MKDHGTYEIDAMEEIKKWELSGRGAVATALDIIGKPVEVLFNAVPGSVKATIGNSIMGFLEMLKDISYWTYSDRAILKAARSSGIDAASISDLAGHNLRELDGIARRFFNSNKIMAALEGAGCGLGGFALIAADIPALFTISFRSIQQIGSSYGFDMRDPVMFPVIMQIFIAGSGSSPAIKTSALAEIHAAARSLARETAVKKIAGKANGRIMRDLINRGSESLSVHLTENISKRKMSQALPLVGAAVGAGFNYWFMCNIVLSAYMIFRKIHLEKRYSSEPNTSSDPAALKPRMRHVFRSASR